MNESGTDKGSHSIREQSTDSCWILRDLTDTIQLGQEIIKRLPEMKILFLKGPLGAGKTSLVKGIANSLGILEPITSPTFALAQHYLTGTPPLVHLDLYRLEEPETANELFLQEEEEALFLGALMVIEWPERLGLPIQEAWVLEINHSPDGGRIAQLIAPRDESRNLKTSS